MHFIVKCESCFNSILSIEDVYMKNSISYIVIPLVRPVGSALLHLWLSILFTSLMHYILSIFIQIISIDFMSRTSEPM